MKNFLTYFLSCILTLATCFSFAQETKAPAANKDTGAEQSRTIDSLLNVLKTLTPSSPELKPSIEGESAGLRVDTTKINILNALSRQYKNTGSYDQALLYAQQAKLQGEKIILLYKDTKANYAIKKGIAAAYNNIGLVYWNKGNYEEGMSNYLKSLVINEEIGNKKGIANCYNNIGLIYWDQGNYEKALYNILKALKIRESLGDKDGIAMSLLNIGNIYTNRNDYENGLKFYLKALKTNENTEKKLSKSIILNNIGEIYFFWHNYIKALDYYLQALKISEEIGDKNGVAGLYYNMGKIYFIQASSETTKNLSENGYKNALDNYLKSLTMDLEIGNIQGVAMNYNTIGKVYMKQSKLNESYDYAFKSLTLCKKIGYKEGVKDAYSTLSEIYEKKGEFKHSLEYHKLFSEMKDTLLNAQSSKQIAEMNTRYDSEKKDKEIQLLNNEKKSQERFAAAEQRKQQVILFSVSGVSLLLMAFAMITYRSFRQKQFLYDELEKLSIVASETDNGVLICGPHGELEWANEGLKRLLGYSLEEIKKRGKTLEEVSASSEIKSLIHQSIENKKSLVYQTFNIDIDGKERWLQSTLTPILDKSGNVKKLVVIDTDVSERKKIEEQLSEQNKELEKSHKYITEQNEELMEMSYVRKQQKEQVEKQSKIIHQKNKDITDSIVYAKQIQDAILPNKKKINDYLKDIFIFYQPRDIVSGDFYWFTQTERNENPVYIIAAADCTGHGVPGAFMSMIGHTLLNQIVHEKKILGPSEILGLLDQFIKVSLKQEGFETGSRDGMDIALCTFELDIKTNEFISMEFSGALRPLYHLHDTMIDEITPNKISIGGYLTDLKKEFISHKININKGDCFYIFSDGFPDQFGGPKGKKFMTKNFKNLLLSVQHLSMEDQGKALEREFNKWKGEEDQVDDIMVIGIRV